MALVKYGAGVVQASGSIGGTTFSRNRFGNYMRAKTKPVNPASAGQGEVRTSMSFLVEAWNATLTAAQRIAWNSYGSAVAMKNRLGETIYLTGFNHFIRANSWLKRNAKTIIAAGPTALVLPEQDPVFSIAASAASGDITITYDDTLAWDNETGGYLIVYQGTPQAATRNFFNGPWRQLGNIPGETGTPVASPQDLSAVFTLVAGQKIWCYARIIRSDGRMSNPFAVSAIVGA